MEMLPRFAAMGQHSYRMGSYGNGLTVEVLNNLLAASNTAVTRLVLGWRDQASSINVNL